MRAILVLLALVCLVAAAALYLGFVNFEQTRPAVVQAPAFHADVGRVAVGSETKTVQVPTLEVQRAGGAGNAQGR